MSNVDIIRAWKDEEYRLRLSGTERAQLPEHPEGLMELAEGDLADVGGGDLVANYWMDPFYLRCFYNEDNGQLKYCDIEWVGKGGS